jgi:hypothetical protein
MRRLLRGLGNQRGAIRLTAVLVPLSIAPILAVTPMVHAEYQAFLARFQPRAPLAAPTLKFDPAQLARWRPLPEYRGAIPILLYHGINDRHDHYSVSQRQFAEQMAMLKRANFRTISVAQYVRFLHGDVHGLPIRPILITFDGGRWDSYAGADAVLERSGFRATISVIAGQVGHGRFYPNWSDLRRMRSSGRWDVELEAGLGAGNIRIGVEQQEGPFYANLRVSPNGRRESFAAYRRRVTSDIDLGISVMRAQLPRWQPHLMALPFGNYGQLQSNDHRVGAFLSAWLHSRFNALLLEGRPVFSVPGMREASRYQVVSRTTADRLYSWLRNGLSYSAWTARERKAHVALVMQPLRDRLKRRLTECKRLRLAGSAQRAVAICERRAAADRRELDRTRAQLRLAAAGAAR